MVELVLENTKWDDIAGKYYINRRTVGKYRKSAIKELDELYKAREEKLAAYLLS